MNDVRCTKCRRVIDPIYPPCDCERVSRTPESDGSVLYSCKLCGMKPEPINDGDCGLWQYACECGAAGSWAETTEAARIHWNKIAFCPNWNAQNDTVSVERK